MMLSHLSPLAQKIAVQSSRERISWLLRGYWVSHTQAAEAMGQLEDLFHYIGNIRTPYLLLLGKEGSGKTTLVERFKYQHPNFILADRGGEVTPVLVVHMSSKSIPKSFYASILKALSVSERMIPPDGDHEIMAVKYLKDAGVQILIIEDIQHVFSGKQSRQQRLFCNMLRFIGNELKVPIVCTGDKNAYQAICGDEQLVNRFRLVVLPLWRYDAFFMELLEQFKKTLPLRKPSDFLTPEMCSLVLTHGGGTIGGISKLLTQAAIDAILSGKEYIDQENLMHAQP